MHESADQQTTLWPRLRPDEVAGARLPGLSGWAKRVRRRAVARLRGEQDVSVLVAQGLTVGRDVFIARGCYFDPGFVWLVSIGDHTTIGPNVTILTHDATPKLRTGYSAIASVRIGARVFVGAHSVILPGVVVGDDAIVGAGSVVRRDVRAGAVVLGNPAEETGSSDAHTRRHMDGLQRRPRYVAAEWRRPGRGGAAARRRIFDELAEGPGYVE